MANFVQCCCVKPAKEAENQPEVPNAEVVESDSVEAALDAADEAEAESTVKEAESEEPKGKVEVVQIDSIEAALEAA